MDKKQFAADLIEIYAAEARDHLEETERLVTELDPNGDYAKTIDRIFRMMHSVKGGAFATSLNNLGKVAHGVESILELIRDKTLKPSAELNPVLLEAVDLMIAMITDQENYGEKTGIDDVLAKIQTVLPTSKTDSTAKGAAGTSGEDSLGYEIFYREPVAAEPVQASAAPTPQPPAPRAETAAPPAVNEERLHATEPAPVVHNTAAPKDNLPPAAKGPSTIRINVDMLDNLMRLAGELVLIRNQFKLLPKENIQARANAQRLDVITTEIQSQIVEARLQPLSNILSKIPRLVRDLGRKLDKKIEVVISGEQVELDKTILETLTDPILHMIRNCCDHGIEVEDERLEKGKPATGKITIHAYHEGGLIHISMRDDGRGMSPQAIRKKAIANELRAPHEINAMTDAQVLDLIFIPGFSTAASVTSVSGRGVGMDVVKTSIEKLGGAVEVSSTLHVGTEIILHLPLPLAIIPCLIIRCGGDRYAIPQVNVIELVFVDPKTVGQRLENLGHQEVFHIRGHFLPVVRLRSVMQLPDASDGAVSFLAVLRAGTRWFGLIFDEVAGTEEIVVSAMHNKMKGISVYSGATVMGDGRVALILDALGIMEYSGLHTFDNGTGFIRTQKRAKLNETSLLLFKMGNSEQFAIRKIDIKRVVELDLGSIHEVGNDRFYTVDGVSIQVFGQKYLREYDPAESHRTYLIILKQGEERVGIACSYLTDIGDFVLDLTPERTKDRGIDASILVNEVLTLLIDAPSLVATHGEGL